MLNTVEAITARLLEVGDDMAFERDPALLRLDVKALEWIDLRRQLKAMKEEV